jgi:hypothetical protein
LWENVAYGALNRYFIVGALDIQLHSFLTVALYGGECTLGKNTLVPDEYESRWVPEPVWTFWQGGKSLMLLGIKLQTIQPIS